jgi:single-strand DNA-binding protein
MPSLNKVYLIGNITRDPELRHTPKGTAVVDISLAINRVTGGGETGNERKEETTFVEVTLWGRNAEIVGQFCKKGKPLMVEGRLELDTWEDRETRQKRSRLKVIGENLQLLGAPAGRAENGSVQGRPANPQHQSAPHRRTGNPAARQETDSIDQPF